MPGTPYRAFGIRFRILRTSILRNRISPTTTSCKIASPPAVGARAALTAKLGAAADVTVGGSGMYGTYDPKNDLHYAILGTDLSVRLRRTSFRAECLVRRTDMDTSDEDLVNYAIAAKVASF
jgi:hypothetical protein